MATTFAAFCVQTPWRSAPCLSVSGPLAWRHNSAALCQGGVADQNAVGSVLAAFSGRRPVYWLYCENEEVLLRTLDNGHMMELKLANKDGHGRWLEWL